MVGLVIPVPISDHTTIYPLGHWYSSVDLLPQAKISIGVSEWKGETLPAVELQLQAETDCSRVSQLNGETFWSERLVCAVTELSVH